MSGAVRDVVIIGSGAGGGSLALALAEAGLDVLVLEKGKAYRREDYRYDEVAISRRDFFLPPLDREPHTLLPPGAERSVPTYLGWTGSCVGGGTVRMGAFLYRFHPDDFRLRSRFGEVEEVADWPFSYDALEPYYSRAETLLGVSGDVASYPFEGPRSAPLPLPPLDAHPLAEYLEAACERLGWHAFPTPRGIASRPYRGRPACSYCGFCADYGCRTGAKGSAQETLIADAVRTGHCEVRPETMVRRITVDAQGQAAGCLSVDRDGREERIRARVVCVCCSAVESARLLLLSTSSQFPDGLANGNGRVGRHLQLHAFSNGRGVFEYGRHPELPLRHTQPFLGRSVMDHYFLPPGISEFPKGGILRFGFPAMGPIARSIRLAEEGGSPLWGESLRQRLHEYFHDLRMIDFEVFQDFVPNEQTRIDLDPDVRDCWGLPVARLHLDEPSHHRDAGRWLVDRGLEVLDAMGADTLEAEEIGATAAYLVHGTCRAGHDPETSVLDPFCRSHQVPNLFVVDGSFMPTSGGAPPTLTIVANGLRVADHLLALGRRGELVV